MIMYLLELGANIETRDVLNRTAMDLALAF